MLKAILSLLLPGLRRQEELRKEGIIVIRRGRDEHIVEDGDRRIVVNTEMQSGDLDFVIYKKSISHWMPPYDHETVPAAKQAEVLMKIERYMKAMGRNYKVE